MNWLSSLWQLEDQRIAARTIQHLRLAKQKGGNFFIAVRPLLVPIGRCSPCDWTVLSYRSLALGFVRFEVHFQAERKT